MGVGDNWLISTPKSRKQRLLERELEARDVVRVDEPLPWAAACSELRVVGAEA